MKKALLAAAILGLLGTHNLAARANSNVGCGLGSYLIDKQGLVWNILQVTTNGTLFNQTFGISSGTLGCR